jgi:hypothetical protein
VNFLPVDKEWIGFGEMHPADGNRKDDTDSQANRRVEILFFEHGHEPDVTILKEAPDITELYLPDAFVRERLVADSAKPGTFLLQDVAFGYEVNLAVDAVDERKLLLRAEDGRTFVPLRDAPALGFEGTVRLCEFSGLPIGRYDLVELGSGADAWLLRGIRVTRQGVFAHGRKIESSPTHFDVPDVELGTPAHGLLELARDTSGDPICGCEPTLGVG